MSNKLYPKWKEALLQGASDSSLAGTVKAILVDLADYTYLDAHQFLSDVPGAARVAMMASGLVGKDYTLGVFDATNITWPTVVGDVSEAIILFIDTGVEGTSRLVCYLDTGITGIPVTPNGGDIDTSWDDGANKIFQL